MDNEVLSIETPLRLSWRRLPGGSDAASLRAGNRLLFSLLEAGHEPAAHDPHHHASPELQRIEHKLNLLIGMVGQLLGAAQPQTGATTVRLSCRDLQWWAGEAPPAEELLLDLYLEDSAPRALEVIARVVSVKEKAGRYRIEARFVSLDEYEENQLEKWIFARHRRMVAQARARNPSG